MPKMNRADRDFFFVAVGLLPLLVIVIPALILKLCGVKC